MVRVANEYLHARCRVQQDNPKKNIHDVGYDRYKAARTLQEVLDLGGSRGDIGNDMLRGYIVCDDRAIHEEILMTANDSERRHLPQYLLDRLPSLGADPRARPAAKPRPKPPPPPPTASRFASSASSQRSAPPPQRKLAPPPTNWANAGVKRERADAPPSNDARSLRKRAIACNKRRAKVFGRNVGKGRLLEPLMDGV